MEAMTLPCDVCGRQYQHGPHRYEGHKLHAYDMMVCDTCYKANWDGWGPMLEPLVVKKLRVQGHPYPGSKF